MFKQYSIFDLYDRYSLKGMSEIIINKVSVDSVELEITQFESNEAQVVLRDNLLDGALNYKFAVTELSVNLQGVPLFPITQATRLFRIVRRNVGADIRVAVNIEPTVINGSTSYAEYSIHPNYPFYDVGDFTKDLSRFVRTFNNRISRYGVLGATHGGNPNIPALNEQQAANNPHEFLTVSLSCDGSLLIEGLPIFWDNFMIEFPITYGLALLGIDRSLILDNILSFTRLHPGGVPDSYVSKAHLDPNHIIVIGENLQEVVIDTSSAIFETADQRVSLSVESFLPTPNSKKIVDEVESVSQSIAEVFFTNEILTEIKYDEQGQYDGLSLHTKLYSGQHSMIRRSNISRQWNRLLTSFELRLMKFMLFVTYRTWDEVNVRWKLDRQKMNVPKNTYWYLNVLFVSDA